MVELDVIREVIKPVVFYPRRWNVAAQVVEELKTITYAIPHAERKKKGGKSKLFDQQNKS